jgi:hypothetical protein
MLACVVSWRTHTRQGVVASRRCGSNSVGAGPTCAALPASVCGCPTHEIGVLQNENNCSKKKTLEKNSNSSEGVEAANKVSRVVQDPLDTPLMDPNIIHGPKTKRWCRSSVANSVRALISTILDNPQGILRWDWYWKLYKILFPTI